MSKSVVIRETGNPSEVVRVEEEQWPAPGAHEILVRMLYAPINPADINTLQGTYGKQLQLPAVIGAEGVGEVIEAGEKVQQYQPGDKVLLPYGVSSWREQVLLSEDLGILLSREIDSQQASMLRINPPTAWRMLHDFENLQEGDWVVQNASNSGVGRAVIKIAKRMGLRTINLVRRAELIDELQALGGDHVLLDNRDSVSAFAKANPDVRASLGLNAVGGESALGVASLLKDESTHVTYGAMGLAPVKIPNRFLIFQNISFRGFWVSRWFAESPKAEIEKMFRELEEMILKKEIVVPVAAEYGIDQVADAVKAASESGRSGKILLKLS